MSKKQWKAIGVSLQFSVKSDWSQEEVDSPLSDINSIRSSLPTQTHATRQTAELDNIPENGPFILNFANIPFDASESDLRQFFKMFIIANVVLNNQRRGCGHIEFTCITDLTGAWKMNDKLFLGRPIRLSIPLKDNAHNQQPMYIKRGYQIQTKSPIVDSEDSDNWRTQKKIEHETVGNKNDASNWRNRGSVKETNDRNMWGRYQSGGRSSLRVEPSKVKEDSGGDNWRSMRGEECARREGDLAVSVGTATSGTKKQSVFGEARPVDTTAKDREIEAKIEHSKLAHVPDGSKSGSGLASKHISARPSLPQTVSDTSSSDLPEWRVKPRVVQSQEQLTSSIEGVKNITKAVPQLVPVPSVNVWEERKKSRNMFCGAKNSQKEEAAINLSSVRKDEVIDRSRVEKDEAIDKSKVGKEGGVIRNSVGKEEDTKVSIKNSINVADSESGAKRINETDTKNVGRPVATVVISAKGPYLDPTNHRLTSSHTDHSSKSNPTAVPITKSHTSIANTASTKPFLSNSSWARGPPKGLLDHHH